MNMLPDKPATSREDLIVWPDGDQCLRDELSQMNHKSDDYTVVPFESEEWYRIMDIEAALEIQAAAWNSPEHLAYLESLCSSAFSGT